MKILIEESVLQQCLAALSQSAAADMQEDAMDALQIVLDAAKKVEPIARFALNPDNGLMYESEVSKPLTTTLNAIREHSPCRRGWEKLLSYLGKTKADDEPLLLETILDSNGLDDALWCLRAVKDHDRDFRLFAAWAAQAQRFRQMCREGGFFGETK